MASEVESLYRTAHQIKRACDNPEIPTHDVALAKELRRIVDTYEEDKLRESNREQSVKAAALVQHQLVCDYWKRRGKLWTGTQAI